MSPMLCSAYNKQPAPDSESERFNAARAFAVPNNDLCRDPHRDLGSVQTQRH